MRKLTLCFLAVYFFISPQLFAGDSREDAAFYNSRGLEYSNKGEYDKAIEDFSRAIRLEPGNAEFYSNRGNAYFNKGEYNQAIEDYSSAILHNPDNAYFYYYRGNVYSWKGEYDHAIENHNYAIQLDHNNADFYYGRGYVYSIKEEYDQTIKDFSSAILLNPDDTNFYYYRGNAYFNKGEYDPAIEDYSSAILLNQDNADLYYYRANLYVWKGEYDPAIEDYSSAILLNQDNADFYDGRGTAYNKKGEYDRAIDDFSQVILLDPNSAVAYFNRGRAYYSKSDYDQAIEDYSHAILLDPNHVNAYIGRGSAYTNKGEYDRAIEDFSQAILLDPNYANAYNRRGTAYLSKGEYDRATEDLSYAIILETKLPSADNYLIIGNAYVRKGEYDRAIEEYSQAILLDPNHATAYTNRGGVHSIKGDYDRAIEDFSQAILLDPNYANAYNNRGFAYYEKGDYDRAIEDFSQAILLDPNHATAYTNRGDVYKNKGEYDRAFEDYKEALNIVEITFNINEIFVVAMSYARDIYTDYPYLCIENDPFMESFAVLAMDGVSRSVRRAEQVRSKLGARGSAIMTQALYFYYMGLDLEAHFGAPEKAFEYSESLRSRGFLDQLGTEAALRLPGIREEERERVRYLLAEIENRRNVLDAFRERPPQNSEEELSFVNAGQTLSVLETELTALDANISSRIPQYAELRNPVPASLAHAHDWLDDDTAVLIYALWDESIDYKPIMGDLYSKSGFPRPAVNSYCLVLTKAGLTTVTLDHDFNYMRAINRLREYIMDIRRVGEFERDRNALYDALIKPALAHIPNNIKNLIIVPDGTLGHLPFDILREDDDSPDLGETYRLSLSPSVSVSMLSEKTSQQNLPILTFGGAWYNGDRTAARRGAQRSVVYGNESNQIARHDSIAPFFSEFFCFIIIILAAYWAIRFRPVLETRVFRNMIILFGGFCLVFGFVIVPFSGAWYNREKTAAERATRRSMSNGNEPNQITWLDLPGTEAEVKMLEQLVPSTKDIKIFMGRDVSEEQVKKLSDEGELARYPMLHFATHGYFREEDLERAGIVLSEVSGLLDNGEDGYLTIPEIAVLSLNAQMVLLSACETGLGVLKRGDGMVGMVRAFLLAGSEHVGVSLWEIDDEATLEFMTRLYSKVINEGKTFKEAYYLVKNEFRYHDEWDHPNYWSAFVLYE